MGTYPITGFIFNCVKAFDSLMRKMVVTTSRIELFIQFLREDFDGDFILIAGDALNGMSIDLPYLQSLANSPSWAFSQVEVKRKKNAPG